MAHDCPERGKTALIIGENAAGERRVIARDHPDPVSDRGPADP
jgi:hypothetical protein